MVRWRSRRAGWLLASCAVTTAAVLAVTVGPAAADVVNISDASHVLDVTRVQNEAATLPDPVDVFTTTKDADNNGAFDTEVQSKVTTTRTIVIAMNTQSHHLAIRTGSASRVSQGAAMAATQAFTGSFKSNSNYTDATIAALDSMKSAIQAAPQQGNRAVPARRSRTGGGVSGLICGGLCLVVVVGLVIFAVSRFAGRRRRSSGPGPGPGYGPGAGYGPGYGPGYGGGGGVNPWVAGGAGAVGGGVLGYELGRMEGEREERGREEYYDRDQGYNNGGDSSWGGGGADGDFGGGGGDSGGSGGSGDSF